MLDWSFDNDGSWEAYSVFKPFRYRIDVTEDGRFDIKCSCPELNIVPGSKPDSEVLPKSFSFASLQEAKTFCEAHEVLVCELVEEKQPLGAPRRGTTKGRRIGARV